jgi:hypothetical protein
MRELLLKNLTSLEKKRKILCWAEVSRNNGILTKVNRRFIYVVREHPKMDQLSEQPEFFIFKKHDTKLKTEKFILRIKGNFYVTCEDKIYLVTYCHSLKIRLAEQPEDVCSEKM